MRLPRQMQACQPSLDAAGPGGLARAVEAAAAGAEKQLRNLAVQRLVGRLGGRENTVVQQQREQQPGLMQG